MSVTGGDQTGHAIQKRENECIYIDNWIQTIPIRSDTKRYMNTRKNDCIDWY